MSGSISLFNWKTTVNMYYTNTRVWKMLRRLLW